MSSEISTDPGLRPWQLFVLAGMLAATGVVLVSTGQTLPGVVVLSLTVVVSSFVAVAGFRSLSPLVTSVARVDDTPVIGRARAALEREKALVLRTIKELEFDHAMGKTSTADFEEMRDRLRLRAVGLIRQLDGADYRHAIEQDLAARHATGSSHHTAPPVPPRHVAAPAAVSPTSSDHAPRASDPERPAAAPPSDYFRARAGLAAAPAARVCGTCATVNDVDARFCKQCGGTLAKEPA